MSGFHWMKVTDRESGELVYKVTNGYHARRRLRELGFDFDRRRRIWVLRLGKGDLPRVTEVEGYLRVVEEGGQ